MKTIQIYSDEVLNVMWSALMVKYQGLQDTLHVTLDCPNNGREDSHDLVHELNMVRHAMDAVFHAQKQ